MTDETTAPSEGALSFDQAVGVLSAEDAPEAKKPVEKPVKETIEEDTEAQAATEAEDASESEETGDGDDAGDDDEAEAEAVDAPQWWDAEDKATFAELSPEVQAVIRRQEDKREAVVAKTKAEAAEARARVKQELDGFGRYKQALDVLLPQAVETFKGRWAGVDAEYFARWAEEDPVAAFQGEKQFQAEQLKLQNLRAAQQVAERHQYEEFIGVESEKLQTLVPDLVDPVKGTERKRAVADFLVKAGVSPDALPQMDAVLTKIAYDAYRYGELESSARAALSQKTKSEPARPGVKPGASQPGSRKTEVQQLSRRLSQTRSIDDGVALMIAKGL